MTLFASSGNSRTFDYQPGDVSYIPASFGILHSVYPRNPSLTGVPQATTSRTSAIRH